MDNNLPDVLHLCDTEFERAIQELQAKLQAIPAADVASILRFVLVRYPRDEVIRIAARDQLNGLVTYATDAIERERAARSLHLHFVGPRPNEEELEEYFGRFGEVDRVTITPVYGVLCFAQIKTTLALLNGQRVHRFSNHHIVLNPYRPRWEHGPIPEAGINIHPLPRQSPIGILRDRFVEIDDRISSLALGYILKHLGEAEILSLARSSFDVLVRLLKWIDALYKMGVDRAITAEELAAIGFQYLVG